MPLTSQVGREETCSISRRPFSPAGIERPIGLRNYSARQIELRPLRQDVRRQILHAIVEAGNGDAAVVVEQAAEDAGQHPDRVLRAAAENAGMQIAVGGLDPDFFIDQAAQRRRDRRRVRVPHAGVAHQREVGLEVLLVRSRNGTKFFEPTSSSPSMTMVTSTGSEPVTDFQARQASTKVINWPLSSSAPRATMILRPSAWSVTTGSNGGRCHKFERIDRLNIVVAIEQHMRPPPVFR